MGWGEYYEGFGLGKYRLYESGGMGMRAWEEEDGSWGSDVLVLVVLVVLVVRMGAREGCRSEGKVVDGG